MTQTAHRPERRFLTLDGMRGIAALLILAHHFPDPHFNQIFRSIPVSVDMFFVLSGFVLAHAYGWDLASKTGGGGAAFLHMRLVRIYPLYMLGSVLSLVAYLAIWATWHSWGTIPDFFTSLVAGVFFVPLPPRMSFNKVFIYPFNQPAWSLFFELAANFLFALVNWTVPRLLAVIAVGGALLALAYNAYGTIDIGWTWEQLPSGVPRVLYSFFLGVLLCRFQPNWSWRVPAPLPLLLLLVAFALPESWELPIAMVFIPLLVFLGSMTTPGPLLGRLCKLLGDISYPFYALHFATMLLMMFAYHMATGRELKDAGIMGTVAGMVVTVIAAYYAGKYFDPAARKWMKNAVARLGQKAAPA